MTAPEQLSNNTQAQAYYIQLETKLPEACRGCFFASEFVGRQVLRVMDGVPIELAELRVGKIKTDCVEGLLLVPPHKGEGPSEAQCNNVQAEVPNLPNSE